MRRTTVQLYGFALALLIGLSFFIFAPNLWAQEYIDASKLLPKSAVFFSPRSGSFVEGSTFDVPILLDTKGVSINGIEVRINFDEDKLSIVQPSSGQSIIGVWVEPPKYDNVRGTASYVGVVPNGIVTDSGLIGTITFKAKTVGRAVLSVRADSNILLNDGLGTDTAVELGRAEYTILPKAPDGVLVYSETHPSQSEWYNNQNPVLAWESEEGVSGYSYVLDNKPNTVPGNEVTTTDVTKAYEELGDGLWYFHIKANKNGAWSNTGHFLLRIDTTPPALFEPKVEYVLAAVAFVERALVSYFTSDSLSGIDHYEVGVIDKSQPITESPSFVQAESPYQVPTASDAGVRVVVRAVDKAGNVRDVSVDVQAPTSVLRYMEEYLVPILLLIILLAFLVLLFHYVFGHHIVRNLRRAFAMSREEESHTHDEPAPAPARQTPPAVARVISAPSPEPVSKSAPEPVVRTFEAPTPLPVPKIVPPAPISTPPLQPRFTPPPIAKSPTELKPPVFVMSPPISPQRPTPPSSSLPPWRVMPHEPPEDDTERKSDI